METIKSIAILIIVIAVIFFIFYRLWKWVVKVTVNRSKKMTDEALQKAYKGTSKNTRLITSVVMFLFTGFFAIYFYYMFKRMHNIYQDELMIRNVSFDKVD